MAFTLPAHKRGIRWHPMLDTALPGENEKPVSAFKGGEQYEMEARSIAVLRLDGKQEH